MANGDGKFGPTWKWIVGTLGALLIAVLGTLYGDIQGNIKGLWDKKLDKEQYRCDQARIEGKLDKLIDIQINGVRGK